MKFVYAPEGAERKAWDFDPNRLLNVEAEVIERQTGFTFNEWLEKVQRGSMLALHGLLFVLLKRENHKLQWDQVQFTLSELDFELDDDETAELYASLAKREADGEELDESEKRLLEGFREQGIEEPGAADPKGELVVSSGTST